MAEKTLWKQVLLLNADGNILSRISIKRAITLFLTNKVNIILCENNDKTIHPKYNVGIPSIVSLREYKHIPYRRIPVTRKRILMRDNYSCQYCQKELTDKNATIDHVIPKSRKGSPGNTWDNVVACCPSCNHKKADKTPSESNFKLIRKPKVPKMEELLIGNNEYWNNYFSNVH